MAKPGNPYHDPATGEFTSGPDGGGTLRYSRMGKQARAKIATSHFKTRFDSTGKAAGEKPGKYAEGFMKPWKENARAVALKTAKALDRDAHRERDRAADQSIKDAIAKAQVQVTKVPAGVRAIKSNKGSGRPRNPGKKQRIHGYTTMGKFWK